MNTSRIVSQSIALLLALPAAKAAPDTLSGDNPAWAVGGNWSLGVQPGVGNNAVINATGTVDVNGTLLGGLTEIQDLTFDDPSGVILANGSASSTMDLVLNGGRGAGVPLIQTIGDAPYTIQGPGTNVAASTLRLVLKASGDINVGSSDPNLPLTISSIIAESGGARSLRKTGSGKLALNGVNTFTGGVTIASGIVAVASGSVGGVGKTGLGTGPVTLAGGTLQVRDNGTSTAQTLNYGNNVVVQAGGGSINVDRISLNSQNRVQFGTLTIGAQTLGFSAGNNYQVRFSGTTTMTGAATFDVGSGGSQAMQVFMIGAVGGGFDLTKTGVGILRLQAATNTYSGQTNINGGSLALTGAIGSSSRINVAAGATFDVGGVSGGFKLAGTQTLAGAGLVTGAVTTLAGATLQPGGTTGVGTLTFSSLTFGVAAGDANTINFASLVSAPKLNVTGSNGLIANGGANSVTINIGGGAPAVGPYPLVDYSGTLGGGGPAAFRLGTLPTRVAAATLVNNTANTSIDLNVTAIDFPIWKGALNNEWTSTVQADPKNWVLNSNNATPTDFLVDDNVNFTDLATQTTVNIGTTDVSPGAVVFTNATKNYTITGTKAITGIGGLTKSGAGKVTIATTNSFLGSVTVNGGTVSVSTIGDSGVASGLGAGSSVVLNGSTLEYTGAAATTNRALSVGAGGATISINNSLTFRGSLSIAGPLTVNNGTLGLSQSGSSTLNAVSGTGGVSFGGGGTFTLGGAANTYTGVTEVSNATLIAGKTAGVTAIPGDLIINAGGAFRYAGNNVSNQIADTSSITINGGTFGDPNIPPIDPGATDTVANVTVNGGTFNSGRNVNPGPFTITGTLHVLAGGVALAQRAGIISASTVQIGDGSVNLDGGSTTLNAESRLDVGSGGLALTDGAINFNSGPSAVSGGSHGSIVRLGGDVTSTGASQFVRMNPGLATAVVDLQGATRTFNVEGTLAIGTDDAPISIINGGIQKTGGGNLEISASTDLTSLDIETGVVTLGSSAVPAPAPIDGFIASSAQVETSAVPEPGGWALLCLGGCSALARRRRG